MQSMKSTVRKLRQAVSQHASFASVLARDYRYLYAGDVPNTPHYERCIGLSLTQADARHIRHDILQPLPLPDNCIDLYQAEDVFEHIPVNSLGDVIHEIYRILRPGGVFRCSMPDYRCDILSARSLYDVHGKLVFDPYGGGSYVEGRVVGGGHVWFPKIETVRELFEQSPFTDVTYYHYHGEDGSPVTKPIDYGIAYVGRTPDHDARVRDPWRPLSIVLDARK